MYLTRAFLVCILFVGVARVEETFRFPPAKIGDRAELKYVGKVPVLTVSGSPEEIGSAVGTLALRPGKRVLQYPRDLLVLHKADALWNYFKGAGRKLYAQFPPEFHDELEAVVRGAECDRDLVIAGNTFFDLKKVFACSALLLGKERSESGGPVLARNLDYPSLGYIHKYSLVTIYRPRGKLAFASVGFPGLVGVLSGMNEAGLALGVLEVFDTKDSEPKFDARGVTYGLCLRRILEEAKTIDEARAILGKFRRTATINVVMADRKRVAVLEVTPTRVLEREEASGVCVCTNHFCLAPQKAEKPANIDRSFERFARLEQVARAERKLGPDDLRQHLDAVNLGTLTLQTMVFEPRTLRLYLGFGKVPSTKQAMERLDLAELLRPGK